MTRKCDKEHVAWIRELPCVICGYSAYVECCHIRMSDPRAAKVNPGLGQKPDDVWTLPMCGKHHRLQHSMGERKFWEDTGADPIFIAMALYRISGDNEAGEQIIREAQR